MEAPRHRPFGVTVLAILAGIIFVVNAFVTLLFLGAIPATIIGGTGFFGEALLGAIIWGLLAAIWAWVAAGLWNLRPGAWLFVVILSLFNLIVILMSILGGSAWQAMWPSLLFNVAILIYSQLPGVRGAFEQTRPQP